MALSKGKLEKLRKITKLHANWFVAAVLGKDMLTAEERGELDRYKNLPDLDLSLVDRSFLLGRLKALLKRGEWKDLNWESLLEADSVKLTPLEKLAVQQAKLQAAKHVRSLVDRVVASVEEQVGKAAEAALSEASLKGIISDEVAIGILEKKHYKDVASSMATRIGVQASPMWEKISRTEMHAAKTSGLAQAIINKVDIYKNSDGVDSLVSIVPHPGTCPDCAQHYLDKSGNPKVFKLSTLLSAGSNETADHSKKNKIHVHWRSTLPPLHPNCRCELVFIPPGYSWVSGKLSITDRSAIRKASDDRTMAGGKLQPAGPPGSAKPPGNPTIAGAKSPSQATGALKKPGSDPGGRPSANPAGVDVKYVPKDSVKEKPPGTIRDTDSSYVVIPGVGKDGKMTPEQENLAIQEKVKETTEWNKQKHPDAVVLDHMKSGTIIHKRKLGGDEAGVSASYKVAIEGNGNGLMKPNYSFKIVSSEFLSKQQAKFNDTIEKHKQEFADGKIDQETLSILTNHARDTLDEWHNTFANYENDLATGQNWTEGCVTVPHGTGASNEKSAYNTSVLLGIGNVPPTEVRYQDGQRVSMQSWHETAKTGDAAGGLSGMYESTPAHLHDELEGQVSDAVVLGLVMNHQDSHSGNILYDSATNKIHMIDNSAAFATGMNDTKNTLLRDSASMGKPVKVKDSTMHKLKNTTFSDVQRAHPHLESWQAGQTFLRMKYIEHLQRTEGHLDPDKFIGTMTLGNGTVMQRGGSKDTFEESSKRGTLPNQLFEEFAQHWMTINALRGNAEAKMLYDMGVFMPPTWEAMSDPKAFRAAGKHKEYGSKIAARLPEDRMPATRFAHIFEKTRTPPPQAPRSESAPEKTVPAKTVPAIPKSKEVPDPDKTAPRGKKINKGLYIRSALVNKP